MRTQRSSGPGSHDAEVRDEDEGVAAADAGLRDAAVAGQPSSEGMDAAGASRRAGPRRAVVSRG